MGTKILIIGYVWPEPKSSAASGHMMQIIEQFQLQNWRITFASPAQPRAVRANLNALGIAEQKIALNCSSFDVWVKELNPNIVLFDRFMMEEQFGWRVAEQCPAALRILETSDIFSLREIRQKNSSAHTNEIVSPTPKSLYLQMTQQDITKREIASIYRCDLTLILSDFEMQLLIEQFKVPSQLLCYCPFMLDAPNTKNWPAFEEREGFISIGNFLHPPNWDSVLFLKQTLWPLIRKQLAQAQLYIYGAYAPQKALEFHKPKEGFHVLGWIEDAEKAMSNARIALAPLRFGAGIKGKIADAMACGTPIVTTSIGAEGMGLTENIHDTAQELANAAAALYQNKEQWQQTQQENTEILINRFNKKNVGANLIQNIYTHIKNINKHRADNFVGLMLQHHQHKSTEYMSRWIETKNKRADA